MGVLMGVPWGQPGGQPGKPPEGQPTWNSHGPEDQPALPLGRSRPRSPGVAAGAGAPAAAEMRTAGNAQRWQEGALKGPGVVEPEGSNEGLVGAAGARERGTRAQRVRATAERKTPKQ